GPAGVRQVGVALAEAAFAQYPDADPARELQLLAVGELAGCEEARKELLRAPGPPEEAVSGEVTAV
ncbi:MAG: hypothetical protein ACHQ5A_15460, partial [Opitutales bacterium]